VRWLWQQRPPEPAGEPPVPDDTPTRPLRVFEALERHGVDYVAIGGIAVQAHGHTPTTRDVDVLVGPEQLNLERLAAALVELRARLLGVDAHLLGIDPTDPQTLREGGNFTLMTTGGGLDVWTDAAELKGAASWPELRARALEARVSGVRIRVCGRDDLIRMKRAADRPKDRQDIVALTEPAAANEHGPIDVAAPPAPEPQTHDAGPRSDDDRRSGRLDPPVAAIRPVADLGGLHGKTRVSGQTEEPRQRPGSSPGLGV
jgi:hypothetical protein